MVRGEGIYRMKKDDIRELMELRGWSKAKLAAELGLGENIVYRWLNEDRMPGGPASILMRQWLAAARAESTNGRRKLVGAK